MEDQVEGGLKRAAGRVEDVVGAATADAGLQAKGKARQIAGQLQQQYGSAVDSLREQAVANPIATVGLALGVGFLLGAFWARRD